MIPSCFPSILAWIVFFSLIIRAILELRGHGGGKVKRVDHDTSKVIRVLSKLGWRPPDPRDYK